MHKVAQCCLLLKQLKLCPESRDVICKLKNKLIFAFQLQIQIIQVLCHVNHKGQISLPCWINHGNNFCVFVRLASEEFNDLFNQLPGSLERLPSTQPAHFTIVNKVTIIGIDFFKKTSKLAMIEPS